MIPTNSSKVDILFRRLTREEGERLKPYDDATGLTVKAPHGKLTWGRGFNLEECGSPELFEVMELTLLNQHDRILSKYQWYIQADSARGSVILDMAYNAGDSGVLLHFPHLIAAFARKDWPEAAAQCTVIKTDPKLDASRYELLRQILLTGESLP